MERSATIPCSLLDVFHQRQSEAQLKLDVCARSEQNGAKVLCISVAANLFNGVHEIFFCN